MSTQRIASCDRLPGVGVGRHGRGLRHGPGVLTLLLFLATAVQAAPPGSTSLENSHDQQEANVPLSEIAGAPPPGLRTATETTLDPPAAAHFAAASKHFEARDYAPAAAELDAALLTAAVPTYDLLYLQAQIKMALARFGEARLAAEQALIYRPQALAAHLLLGRLHRRQERLAAAIAHLRSAALSAEKEADNPHAPLAWYELGDCLAQAGYLRAAAEAFERFDRLVFEERGPERENDELAVLLKQLPYGAIERRLELLQRVERSADRVAAAKWAFENRPAEPYLERLYVRTLLDAGHADTAFAFCRERLATPGDPNAGPQPLPANRLTLALETARAANQLDDWIGQVVRELPAGGADDLARTLATRLSAAGDQAHAIPLWRALATAKPENTPAVWALAGALKESGDLAAALSALIEAVRQSAGLADIPAERLTTWMRSFSVADDFLRLVQDFTARSDCDFATYTVLATTAAAAGQTELAERLFQSALAQRPGYPLAHLAWGRMNLSQYRWPEALEHAEQALREAPQLCAAHLLAAEAQAGLDYHDRAEQAYRAALRACPDDAACALALARHLRRTGNLLAAQRYYQQAWSLDRSLAAAVEELVECYLEGGKLDVARDCVQQAEASDVPDDVLRRMRTGLRFAAAPFQEPHLAELGAQFAQHPDDVTTGLKLAGGLYLRYRSDEALRVLEQVEPRLSNDERVMHLLARVYLRRLDTEKAVNLLEEAVRRYPRRPGALRLLAGAYIADFRTDAARQTVSRMLELDITADERLALHEELLNLDLEFSRFDAALELVERWITDDPSEATWGRAKERVLLAVARNDEAVVFATARLEPLTSQYAEVLRRQQELEERLRRRPDTTPAEPTEAAELSAELENAGNIAEQVRSELTERRADYIEVCQDAGAYAPAVENLRSWMAHEPPEPQLQEWLIELLLAARRGEEALAVIGTLLPKTPTDVVKALIWRARGYALVERGDDAIKDLTGLLNEGFIQENAAALAQVRQEILTLLVDAGDAQRGLDLCDRWLAATPEGDRVGRFGVLALKRFVLSAAGREEEALALAEQFLDLQPHDPGLNNDIGYTWVDRGEKLERATRMIELAVAAEPLNAAYLDSLGWARYKQRDFAGAQKYLSRAVQLRKGQDATIYDHLADAEYRLGDRRAAREHWQTAAQMLSKQSEGKPLARDVRLLAAVRDKLAALEQAATPAVAPTAAASEQEQP